MATYPKPVNGTPRPIRKIPAQATVALINMFGGIDFYAADGTYCGFMWADHAANSGADVEIRRHWRKDKTEINKYHRREVIAHES